MKSSYLLIDCGNTSTDFYGTNLTIMQNVFCKVSNHYIKEFDLNKLLEYIAIHVERKKFDEVFISSVNSSIFNIVIKAFSEDIKIHVLDKTTMEYFVKKENYKIDNIDYLGADLFCDIISYRDANEGVIVLDCGTASKILVVNKNKEFLGGIIYPGISICNKILSNNTDLLEDYELSEPKNIISLDTKEAIASGTIYGTYYLLVGLVDKIKETYHMSNPKIVMTGGNAEVLINSKIFEKSSFIIHDPLFILKGLARAYDLELNSGMTKWIDIDPSQFRKKK